MARGACGEPITLAVNIHDGDIDLGRLAMDVPLGDPSNHTDLVEQPQSVVIPASGAATPYPSEITVSGLEGKTTRVSVRISNLTHTNPDDLDVLLVAPGGQKFVLKSDCGGAHRVTGNAGGEYNRPGRQLPARRIR